MNRLHMLSIVTAALLATACSGTADSGADTSSDALVDHVHQAPGDSLEHEGATAPGHGAHDLVCPPGLELLPPPPPPPPPPAGGGEGPVGAAPHEGPISFPAIPLCCPAGAPPGDAPVGMSGVIALPSAPSAPSARPPLPPFPPGCVPAVPAPGGEAPPLPASKPGEKPQLD